MFKDKLLIETPHSRLRKTLAILLYVVFMIWIIYSHNKTTNLRQTTFKKMASIY